jgi:hypothetical protein
MSAVLGNTIKSNVPDYFQPDFSYHTGRFCDLSHEITLLAGVLKKYYLFISRKTRVHFFLKINRRNLLKPLLLCMLNKIIQYSTFIECLVNSYRNILCKRMFNANGLFWRSLQPVNALGLMKIAIHE